MSKPFYLFVFLFFYSLSLRAEDNPLSNVIYAERFKKAFNLIKNYYVEPASDSNLYENSIRGMLNGLDPHSIYLNNADMQALEDFTRGEFSGLGMEVIAENGTLKVITPLDDSPSQKAGIKPGDVIIAIDGKSINELDPSEAISTLHGKKGTSVTLTIVRKKVDKPLRITAIRDIIHLKSVKYRLLNAVYGYIRVSSFQMKTADDTVQAIQNLQNMANPKLKGLILDLRNNPGGVLDSAVDVVNAFLDSNKLGRNRLIVYTIGRMPDSQLTVQANSVDITHGIPMVILINEGSASASEVVAGALQDYKRAVIVGVTSFGKGSVQTILPLDHGTALKLTTALYYTPLGRSIQAKGIKPDVIVEELRIQSNTANDNVLREEDLNNHLLNPTNAVSINEENLPTTDYQLFQALNVLKGLIAFEGA